MTQDQFGQGTQPNTTPHSDSTPPAGWQARLAQRDGTLRVHLIGIGGTGLGPIATVLLELGIQVSGSDRQSSAALQKLAAAGAHVTPQQSASNLLDLPLEERPHVVLISSAVDALNPERQAARELGIPIVKRSEFLPVLLSGRKLIAVAGTHGKTTTTAMIVQILREAGIACGYIIGSSVPIYGSAAAGSAPEFVLEADEYDHMFLGLRPQVAVITNVEWDHPDCYPTPASFRRAFMQFSDNVEREGVIIACADDTGATLVHDYAPTRGPRWLLYGTGPEADLRAVNIEAVEGEGVEADLQWWNAPSGRLRLAVAGVHNVRNALAALAVAASCEVSVEAALESLRLYRGSARRFEWKGERSGVTVIDDYAHHPTEVAATLSAARQRYPQRRIWAVFQPHTYSRTRHMLYQMGESFDAADEVIVLDIYAAREQDDGSVTSAELVAASPHGAIRHIATIAEAAQYLAAHVRSGDVVITLGAGDGNQVGDRLLGLLEEGSA
jgi:UDP-N-acetylmuramate--alanine ligase